MGKRSSRSDDGVSVSEYCAGRLRSFGYSELQTIVEVGEKSIGQNFGGPNISGEAVDVIGVSNDVNSSTALRKRELTTEELFPVDIPPG